MALAESARRRGLAILAVALLFVSVVLGTTFWGRSERQSLTGLKTYDIVSSPPAMPASPPSEAVSTPRAAPTVAWEESSAEVPTPPGVSPTAAPGVAFNYRYAFRLSGERIGAVQEEHARACERLGVSRCRIIGMRYRVGRGEEMEAMLAFRLEPGIARRFGRAASELVARSEGRLVDSEISGIDVGSSIRVTDRNIAEMSEELERLEARLRQGGLSASDRSRIEAEAQQLRQTIRTHRVNRDEQQESLATTPMVFQYGSGPMVPSSGPDFGTAASRAADNFLEGIFILFVALVTLLPWALSALLGWGIFRRLGRRLRWPSGEGPSGTPATAAAVS